MITGLRFDVDKWYDRLRRVGRLRFETREVEVDLLELIDLPSIELKVTVKVEREGSGFSIIETKDNFNSMRDQLIVDLTDQICVAYDSVMNSLDSRIDEQIFEEEG